MKNTKKQYNIDFVIIWVDGNDLKWQKEYAKYAGADGDKREYRFRDMDVLRYWFRGVEKFASWVNNVYFVTCGQTPDWLNIDHPKLKLVNHDEFMPREYLPTFSSHAIELNLHRIKGLSEHFVYFNDDTFIVGNVNKSDFFESGMPKQSAVLNYSAPRREPLNLVPVVNTAIINRHFVKKDVMKKEWRKFFTLKYHKYILKNIQFIMGKWFPGFKYFHQPASLLKGTYEEVWNLEYEKLHSTCLHKFRVLTDVNQWLLQDWQICKGNFVPRNTKIGYYGAIDSVERLEETTDAIHSRKYKLVCANDNGIEEFELFTEKMKKEFDEILPEKCAYEK